jgi:lysophospholipase L1-like esterase
MGCDIMWTPLGSRPQSATRGWRVAFPLLVLGVVLGIKLSAQVWAQRPASEVAVIAGESDEPPATQNTSNPATPGRMPAVNRIVFLGDSITFSGGFIVQIEAAVLAQHPDRQIEFLNLGLPSETVSGLSEPGHAGGQFPRPDLHERLQRVLDATRPDLVVACYGMNDGIYYPFSEERFARFRDGIERLRTAVESTGAKLIHLTPAVFDPLPIADRLLPEGLAAYPQPYAGYDEVLGKYSEWLLSRRAAGWEVLDVHASVRRALEVRRRSDAHFTYAKDGVHPNEAGQVEIARPLALAWGLRLPTPDAGQTAAPGPGEPSTQSEVTEDVLELVRRKQDVLKLAWLSATRHLRPGIADGLPLEEAQRISADFDARARQLLSATAEGKP